METSFPQFQSSSDLGKMEIAPEVIEAITGMAASEVDGVSQMKSTLVAGLAEKFGRKKVNKGVKVELGEHSTVVDVSIVVDYGANIPKVASSLQNHIKTTIEDLTGLEVLEVNVHVVGVEVPQDTQNAQKEKQK